MSPRPIRPSSSIRRKHNGMLCETDSDCPSGKCCGVLGQNMCVYRHDHHKPRHRLSDKSEDGRKSKAMRQLSKFTNVIDQSKLQKSAENMTAHSISIEKTERYGKGGNCKNAEESGSTRGCGRVSRWRHLFFIICLGVVCAAISFITLSVFCRKRKDASPKKVVVKQDVVPVAALRNPDVSVATDSKKMVVNLDDCQL
ncbi:uncharacterized protein LOC134232904 [Saccostrea cucullata]|uniref:uncharacterized protein LOC134232904 n=1 Tax=Saccostrea cuccullata TaxID=36930 RepID=UPI002ED542FC